MSVFILKTPKDGRVVIPASVRSGSQFLLVRFSGQKLEIIPIPEPSGKRISRNIWETGDGLHIQAR